MFHAFEPGLLWQFSHPEERPEFPRFGHRSVSPTSSLSDLIALPPSPTSPSPTQAPSEHPYRLRRSRSCTDVYVFPSSFPTLSNVADII